MRHCAHSQSSGTDTSRTFGFTLIEIIVSLGIFSVVAVVALGALTRIIAANNKAQTVQSAVSNLSYALESMSREMRTGTKYYCNNGSRLTVSRFSNGNLVQESCKQPYMRTGGDLIIAFESTRISSDGACNLITAYRFRPESINSLSIFPIDKAEQTTCAQTIADTDFFPIIDPQVYITDYHIKTVDLSHPMMLIQLAGYVGATDRERTYFTIQTAVSARSPSN